MADTRKDRRAPVSLKVRFKSATVDEFIEHYCKDVSRGGIFIKSSQPMAIGTLLKFQFQLKDESSLIKGVGRVVWIRSPEDAVADQPAGMGIKFIKMDNESRAMVDRIVDGQDFDGGAFDQGRATASAQETPSERPHAMTDNFFPEGEPAELPPPEDRTAVRQAAQFLAAALAEGGTDKAAASEAEQKAKEARERTAQIEAQRLAEADTRTTGTSNASLPSMIIDPTLGSSEGKPLSAPPVKHEPVGHSTEPPLPPPAGAPISTEPPPPSEPAPRPNQAVSVTPLPPAKKSPLLPAAILVGIVAVAAWVALKEKPREVEAPLTPTSETARAPSEPVPEAPAPAAVEPTPSVAEPELPDAAVPPEPVAPTVELKNVEVEVKASLPAEAELFIGGESRGKAPLKLQLPEGVATTITASAPGFTASSQEITPSAGQQKPLRFTLSPLPYVVRISTNPPGAKISVGAKRGTAPEDIVLGAAFKGMLGVAARLPGHETGRATLRASDFVQTADNMLATVSLELAPLPPPPAVPKVFKPRPPTTPAPTGSPHAAAPGVDAAVAAGVPPASAKSTEADAAVAPAKPSERPVERPVEAPAQKPAEPAPPAAAPATPEPAKTAPPAPKPAEQPTKPEKLPPNPFG